MELEGAVCVVTGGTRGIGRAVARDLLAAGARVAICGRTPGSVEEGLAGLGASDRAVGSVCDVADAAAVERFAAFVHETLGPARVVVNNAGLAHFVPVAETTVEQFDETMAVNMRGVFLVTRAFLPDLRAQGGHLVNIASLAGRNATPNVAAYAAAKHAVLGFSKSLFAEVRQEGVRVTAVCPGTVVTGFFDTAGWGAIQRPEAKLSSDDVAAVGVLRLPDRALISELDLRPSNP